MTRYDRPSTIKTELFQHFLAFFRRLIRQRGMALYVIIILVLASFVIAFFSARTWHWGYVLLVEAIILSTLGFLLLAAETVRLNAALRTKVNKTQKEFDTFQAQNIALRDGTKDAAILGQLSNLDPPLKMPADAESISSITDLDHELLLATRLRGRVWRNVKPAGPINAQTGAVTATIAAPAPAAPAAPAPVPAGIKAESIVYLFDDGAPQPPAAGGAPQGPQYLGEFSVAQVAAQQVTLQPVLPMDEFERRRLAASRGPWIIYDSMPLDRHEIFLGKTDQELKQKLPAKSVNDYLRDGKPATADDDPARVVGEDENGKRLPPAEIAKATKKLYQRRLHDYASEFDELARRRVVMLTDIDAVKKDIDRLTAAEDVAKRIQAFRQDERQKLTSDLAGVTKEREAIDRHLAQVKQQIARAQQLIGELLRQNDQMVDELNARQLRSRPPGNGAVSPTKATGPLALGSAK